MTMRPNTLSIPAYALAHFGKSLWWNGSELFLTFFLTEYLAMTGSAAAKAIALGLVLGATLDLVAARRARSFANAPRAGQMQMVGAIGTIVAAALLASAALASGGQRWFVVLLANLLFRMAYVFYDLPQNCLMSLVPWTEAQRRHAAAARTAASAAALIAISLGISLFGTHGAETVAAGIIGGCAFVAIGSASLLYRATRYLPKSSTPVFAAPYGSIGWGLALMSVACLTLPAFGKLAPYLAIDVSDVTMRPLIVILALATAGSQLFWPTAIRHLGEGRSTALAGILLLIAGACAQFVAVLPAALLVGFASGALTTIIWSHVAIVTAGRNPLAAAPAFAWLTATAKLALAVAALGIGALLDLSDFHRDTGTLRAAMTASIVLGGVLVLGLAATRRFFRAEKRAELA